MRTSLFFGPNLGNGASKQKKTKSKSVFKCPPLVIQSIKNVKYAKNIFLPSENR